jgi:hypothetical protein
MERITTSVTDQLLAELADRAQQEQPRLFAICGVYQNPPVLDDEDRTYVEWGLEFPEQSIAIAYSPDSMTKSSSAKHMLDENAKLGPARLVWFD